MKKLSAKKKIAGKRGSSKFGEHINLDVINNFKVYRALLIWKNLSRLALVDQNKISMPMITEK